MDAGRILWGFGHEAKRVADASSGARASAPAPAPAPAAKVAFENMTTSQQFHHALAQLQAQPLR
jgi:hypothetical protein